ncbi:hypothetical protein LK533_10645 [Sphingomonas sp. PL-96]|uniref:asparagine synthase-related protein n=1 Tax=Sphingomonas sp. PL-96 TaxID=2887201 RepID=UPI001E485D4D|nr:asparagine synthase-related protein [Sphingomonas sp. PL-96]MCC2977129.1 hypothetical protein [Sphingomonas sp. PL-96]
MTVPRFLAVIAGSATLRATLARWAAAHAGMQVIWENGALVVLASPGASVSSLHDGLVVGRIVGEPSSLTIDTLIEGAWGNYVAFACAGAGGVTIVRAPMGTLPAFVTTIGGALVIASDVHDLVGVAGITPTINWDFMAGHLAFPHLRARATGLAGIDEVMPGEKLVRNDESSTISAAWLPWCFTGASLAMEDPVEAAELVRRAVTEAVSGLVQPFRHPLIELSGGLDSSILAASLRYLGASANAVTVATTDPEGDEREHARRVADYCGLALAIRSVPEGIDLTSRDEVRGARPGLPMILRLADRLFGDVADATHADVFVSGTGGDSVFCSPVSAAPAADLLRRFGPGRQFARTVADLAHLRDASIWRVGAMAVRQAFRPPVDRLWPRATAFLDPKMIPSSPPPHAWFDEPALTRPGKRSHVRSILAAMAHLDGYPRHSVAPSIYPLMSQPVVEACLRVPTWLQVRQGRNRAIAREAFRRFLPAGHVDRRTKGGLDGYCSRAIAANRVRLKPYLLDGALAGAGLLDRLELERYLSDPALPADDRRFWLLPLIDAEAWSRSWVEAR